VKLLDDRFQRESWFDLPTYWQEHVGEFASAMTEFTFTLRIHASRFNFAKWLTPGRCEVIAEDDEWTTARFHMESIELAKMLVFGLGTQCVVVEPRELADAVRQAACEIVKTQPCEW
jgi:predicted DNA-binding transcriptional regulator YafY